MKCVQGLKLFLVLASALHLLTLAPETTAQTSEWRQGRATFYGNEPWLWTIHYGSCGNGYIYPDIGTGWDVTALADAHPDHSGSCGRCYEVKCQNTDLVDRFGSFIPRRGACYDPGASVVVRTTDTCPCNKADNYYSNQRWCCGDVDHLDLSIWAFEKLADTKWGVIGLQYRQVPCGYAPERPAPPRANPFPGEGPEKYGAKPRPSINVQAFDDRSSSPSPTPQTGPTTATATNATVTTAAATTAAATTPSRSKEDHLRLWRQKLGVSGR